MDEHEQRKVGQEVKEVQGWTVPQLPQDGGLLLQTDAAGLQLQQKLFWADEALLGAGISSLLIQEKQEQLLREMGQRRVRRGLPGWLRSSACGFRLPRPLSRRLSAPVNAVDVIIVGAEGGGVGEGIILLAISTPPPTHTHTHRPLQLTSLSLTAL